MARYSKTYRRKPSHKKLVRRRSVLRQGDEGLPSFRELMAESTPRSAPPGAYSNDSHEINWLKNKIASFEPEYTAHMKTQGRHGTKPRRHRQIMEYEKQIKEKGGTPDNHSWIKRD